MPMCDSVMLSGSVGVHGMQLAAVPNRVPLLPRDHQHAHQRLQELTSENLQPAIRGEKAPGPRGPRAASREQSGNL